MSLPVEKCPYCGEEMRVVEGREELIAEDENGKKTYAFFYWYRHSKTDYGTFESHTVSFTKRAR